MEATSSGAPPCRDALPADEVFFCSSGAEVAKKNWHGNDDADEPDAGPKVRAAAAACVWAIRSASSMLMVSFGLMLAVEKASFPGTPTALISPGGP